MARGTQTVSVWKDARELGKGAATIATMLADGSTPADVPGVEQWSGGPNGVTLNAVFLAPVAITQDKLDLVIDAGWIDRDKLCEGAAESAAACQ